MIEDFSELPYAIPGVVLFDIIDEVLVRVPQAAGWKKCRLGHARIKKVESGCRSGKGGLKGMYHSRV